MPEEPQQRPSMTSVVIMGLIVISLTNTFWPDTIPFSFFHFWNMKGTLREALWHAWPIFAWATGMTLIGCLTTPRGVKWSRNPRAIFFVGTLTSIWAGITEETVFRWIIFYTGIAIYTFVNWCTWGLFALVFSHLLLPVANFFTLGYLHSLLFHPLGWTIGAAILSSTGQFRDGHHYLGIVGWLNSWFIGLYFFYLVFTFGLPAAIAIHIIYDLIIFWILAFDAWLYQ